MKMCFFIGWQVWFYLVCLLMLFSVLVVGVWLGSVYVQVQVLLLLSEIVVVELLYDLVVSVVVLVVVEVVVVYDCGDVVWMFIFMLLVLLMVVLGLVLFYGGLVCLKNVLLVFSQILVVFLLVLLLWVFYGYSVVFSVGNLFFGLFIEFVFFKGFMFDLVGNMLIKGLLDYLFVVFQLIFVGIIIVLIVGVFVECIKFCVVLLFLVLWFIFSYILMVYIVWGGGYLGELGVIDFVGGIVVYINVGVVGLVGVWFVGKCLGYGQIVLKLYNVLFIYIGVMLLWVGWFGFNVGFVVVVDMVVLLVFFNIVLVIVVVVFGWILVEVIGKGKLLVLGVVLGVVVGLVGIILVCGIVGLFGVIVIGFVVGVVCVWGVIGFKCLLKVDDIVDVFGVYGVGGIVGVIFIGVFSVQLLGGIKVDLDIVYQVWVQVVSVGLIVLWLVVVIVVILLVVKVVVGLCVIEEVECIGLDVILYGEFVYEV